MGNSIKRSVFCGTLTQTRFSFLLRETKYSFSFSKNKPSSLEIKSVLTVIKSFKFLL